MKKFCAFLLIAVLALAVLVACGDDPNETTAVPQTTGSTPETVDPGHKHIWIPDEENSKAATCTMTGREVFKCSVPLCEETRIERVDILDIYRMEPRLA